MPFFAELLNELAVGYLILYRHWCIFFIVEISWCSLVLLFGFWWRLVDHDVTDPGDRFATTVDSHVTILASVHNPKNKRNKILHKKIREYTVVKGTENEKKVP